MSLERTAALQSAVRPVWRTREIAKKVIDGVRNGQHDPFRLCKQVTAAIELKPHERAQTGIKELAQQSRKLLETTQQLLSQFPEW